MDLRQLEMFKAVARSGGFTRASEQLHVSHSAISRQIKLLEDELGSTLFTRQTRQVSLTPAGEALLPHVDSIFAQLREAVQSVMQTSSRPPKRLSIGTGSTMLNMFLPGVLPAFQEQYPGVDLFIKTAHASSILDEIRSGELDLGIVSLPADTHGLCVHALYRDEIVLAVSRGQPLLTRRIVEPEELVNLPLVMFSRRSSTRAVLDKFFEQIGVRPRIRLEVENDEAAERAIATGAGVCFLPVGRAMRDRIRFLRVRGHRIYRDVALVCPAAPPECVARFLDLCRSHASGLENVA